MDVETIKSKIKKLLTLAEDGNNDHESYAAFQRAQELMAKYKLEQKDISKNKETRECIRKKTSACYGTRSSDHYLDNLADVIAENFCCVNYISTPRGTQTHHIWFMGLEEDVAICEEVLYAANCAIIRGYNKLYNELSRAYNTYIPAKFFNPKKIGYTLGYIAGLKEALESQKEEHQEWGLVMVAPKEAQDFISKLKGVSFGASEQSVSYGYYDRGYEDGKHFHLNKKIADINVKYLED